MGLERPGKALTLVKTYVMFFLNYCKDFASTPAVEVNNVASTITLKDIAKEAQVSIVTVSRVFNNHLKVTD
jgi:AraC-like DNA-binding protein